MFSQSRSEPVVSAAAPGIAGDETAARAIGFAQKYGTPLSPPVYEVWYIYAARTNPLINEALDHAMNTDQQMTADLLLTLFHENVSPRSTSDDLAAIGNDLTSAIGTVTDAMDENMREHSVFSGSLRSARANLVQGSSKREITDVIRDLHKANQQHLQAAQRLNVQLEKSRAHVAKLKSELIEVKRASNTDYLTGLPNRRMLDEHLDNAIFQVRQKKQPLTLLMGSVDGLDDVARRWGVSAADNVVQLFAEQLSNELRAGHVAARFAGSKFAVVLTNVNGQAAFTIAEQVRKRFKSIDWVSKTTGEPIGVLSVSFGGMELADGQTRHALLEGADQRLVRAQREGCDRSVIEPG
ncbi:GGDEF domain-containing protein [Oceanibium sediminis]|uniref:GGDEF domain-containing protein n=1 Tax=Oceanibium sediminis TaxID=2026339 RepID=UPI001300B56A|nr:diguanylate cyclase [Oceanibium sediminis]